MATVSSIGGSALLDDVVDSYAYLPLESYRLYSGVDYFIETYADHFDFFPLVYHFMSFRRRRFVPHIMKHLFITPYVIALLFAVALLF